MRDSLIGLPIFLRSQVSSVVSNWGCVDYKVINIRRGHRYLIYTR
jgi:hypothetical protein